MGKTKNQKIRDMKNLLKILFLIVTVSCSNDTKTEFGTPLIKKHFSSTERQELAGIVSFVDSLVLSKTKLNEIDKAYHYYLDSIYSSAKNGNMDALALDQKHKYAFIFAIDTTLFNKIWTKSTTAKIVKTSDTILYNPQNFISIDLNSNGEFVKMLADLSNEKEYYKDLYNAIEIAGGLSPTNVSGFLISNKIFDFNDQNDRLWAAIFLLTIEESIEIKVQRYLKQ